MHHTSFTPVPILGTIFVLTLLSTTQALTIRLPGTSKVATSKAQVIYNTCQCDCCYSVGTLQRTECVPTLYTTFDVKSCSSCTVASCAKTFPISCEQPTSVVNSDCIVRQGWMLFLVPVLFIGISATLLIYGCFIKKYDGYHPVTDGGDLLRTRSRIVDSANYDFVPRSHAHSWGGDPIPMSRATPSLPPISEHQEMVPPSGIAAAATESTAKP